MMSNLVKLINQLCPNGVDYVAVGSVVNYEQPTNYIVNSTDYNDEFSTPVLTAGQSFILGYTNEIDNLYVASKDNPVVIFDDFTGAFKWVDFPFKVKSSAMKMLTTKSDKAILRYIYHVMGNISYTSDEHKRLWISIYSEIKIPLPPLQVQQEIARILDNFTDLTAELNEELISRKQQYNYYRDFMLTFDNSVEYRPLWQVTNWDKRFNAVENNKQKTTIKYPYLLAAELFALEKDHGDVFLLSTGEKIGWTNTVAAGEYLCEGEVVSVPWGKSRPLSEVIKYYNGKFVTADNRIVTSSDKTTLLNKYLFYWMQNNSELIDSFYRGSGIKHPSMKDMLDLQIAIPKIEEQQRIISILDRFETLVNDIKQGLPAEIAARQKQYEYYRDKLLKFKEVGNESI